MAVCILVLGRVNLIMSAKLVKIIYKTLRGTWFFGFIILFLRSQTYCRLWQIVCFGMECHVAVAGRL